MCYLHLLETAKKAVWGSWAWLTEGPTAQKAKAYRMAFPPTASSHMSNSDTWSVGLQEF